MMYLFDQTNEIIDGPADYNFDIYEYYQKSSREGIIIVKNLLESWFLEFPLDDQKELKSRFKKEFYTSFYELFLFTLFKKQGYEIEVHPKLLSTDKRPDFLIEKAGFKSYVEAKVCRDMSKEEIGFERKKNQLYNEINKIRIKGFLLKIWEIDILSKKQPSAKEFIKFVEGEVSKIERKELLIRLRQNGYDEVPKFNFRNGDLRIVFSPMPMNEENKDKVSNKPIGIYPAEFFNDGGEESLKKSIFKKANRYGKFKIPYLLCINALSHKTSSGIDIENVIWGPLRISYTNNPSDKQERLYREIDGVFHNGRRPILTNVSGVFVTKVFPSEIPNSKYWLYEHPFAKNPFDFSLLDLKLSFLQDGKIVSNEGNDIDRVLDLARN